MTIDTVAIRQPQCIFMSYCPFVINKVDELGELITTERKHPGCSMMCFMKTLLHPHFLVHSVTTMLGFVTALAVIEN